MNDLEYLNQISAGVNQQPKPTGFFDKKMKIVFGILAGVLILFIILLAAGGSSKAPEVTATSELNRLYTRSNELIKTVSTYNGSVRSSSLRSTGTSLSTLLTELSSTSASYLGDAKVDDADPDDAQNLTELNNTLEKARLNGILDRNYAHEMDYQIRYLLIIEDSVREKTTDANLKSYLTSSAESLSRLGDTFNNFSESK
ncbi:hypothetical protein IIZ77_02960 [Candidatus Saccharibacteria bacterium]|nr:hypothetical protein [Candidatus Saccharibacteria bacterium]